MSKGGPITWRFEVQRCDGAEWTPLDSELLGEDDLWDDHIGTHDMPECWDDPLEFARNELEGVLGRLAADCRRLGATWARIVLWTRETVEGDPAIVIQATDEQMSIGRLHAAADEVKEALRGVESARRKLRNQVIAEIGHLGRNQIAREIEGAWTRRLILQFLAGYDLIRDILRVLPHDWPRSSPSSDGIPPVERAASGDEHLGPHYCGPACLMLDATGQVALRLIDVDGPEDPRVTDPWAAEDEIEDYERGAAARAFARAEKVVPSLHRAGFHLTTAEGQEARVTDLADTWQHGSLTVSKSTLNKFSRAIGQPEPGDSAKFGQQSLPQAARLPSEPPVLSGNCPRRN
jgi:hypothetical protein